MPSTVTIKTQGFQELEALFTALPPDVANQVLATGVMAGARVIANEAKKDAPRHAGKQSPSSAKYGDLVSNIGAKLLKKRLPNTRAAIVDRGPAFWGDIINRGSRHVPATRWYEKALQVSEQLALATQKEYMVAKITQLSLQAIQRFGANKQ